MADTATFDTLATARRLKAAGIAGAQAEAIAEAQAEAVRAARGDLATKADIAGLEARFYRALLALGAALVGIMIAVAGVAIGLLQALG